jgi:hypothetical protein
MSKPADKALYDRIKKRIYKRIPKHSAYRSGLIVKEYKEAFAKKYGKKKKAYLGKKTKGGLSAWFKEDWRNQRGGKGYKKKGDIYRPTKRVSKKTPATMSELSKKEKEKAIREKKKTGRVKKFKD